MDRNVDKESKYLFDGLSGPSQLAIIKLGILVTLRMELNGLTTDDLLTFLRGSKDNG